MTVSLRHPTLALVMAGGLTEPVFGQDAPSYRADVDVNGRPLIDYVLQALDDSRVDRTLVFHDDGYMPGEMWLEKRGFHFIPRTGEAASFVGGIHFALRHAVGQYGIEQINKSRLFFLAFDQPLITANMLDDLIRKADEQQFDLAFTMASLPLHQKRFPGRHFRSHCIKDFGERYVLQTPNFVSGAFLHLDPDTHELTFGDWTPEEIHQIAESIDRVRSGRRSLFQVPGFLNEILLKRVAAVGKRKLIARVIARALVGRTRMNDIYELVQAAFRMSVLGIDSECPEMSADIDRPSDIEDFFTRSSR